MYPAPGSGDILGHSGGCLSLHCSHVPGDGCTLQQGMQVPRSQHPPLKKVGCQHGTIAVRHCRALYTIRFCLNSSVLRVDILHADIEQFSGINSDACCRCIRFTYPPSPKVYDTEPSRLTSLSRRSQLISRGTRVFATPTHSSRRPFPCTVEHTTLR
jgi:hypothetical protein